MTALLLVAPILSASLQAGEFLELMRKADGRSEPAERIEYYSRALKAWTPQNGQALLANCRFRRGEAFFDSRKFQSALSDLDKALELDPRNAQAYLLRGKIHLAGGRSKKAAADFEEYSALIPEDAQGQLLLGQTRLRQGQNAAALAAYRKASLLEPADFRAPLGEGLVHKAMKRWSQAKACLDRADSLARHRDAEALSQRGAVKALLGERQGALEDYSDSLPLHENLLSHLERASAPMEEISRQRAAAAQAYYERGRLHEALGRQDQAFSDYERACALGHDPGCGRSRRTPKPKKRRTKPSDDPGGRIYAN